MRSSSEEKWASELAALLSVTSRSVLIGSTIALRFILLDDNVSFSCSSSVVDFLVLMENPLPTGDGSAADKEF
jgi:hypothetical protein